MEKTFQIGDFNFKIIYPPEIVFPKNFLLFEKEGIEPEYLYQLNLTSDFPEIIGKVLAQREDLVVFQTETGEARLIGVKGREGYYACYVEKGKRQATITIDPQWLQRLNIDPAFTSLFALEKRMIQRDQVILHCAYVAYENQAILFSAPSGTGKSTQADLWEQYEKSQTINGDRSLLKKGNGQWFAQGWPVCGSSEICQNQTLPIRAIVMLSQGQDNFIERLSGAQAFMSLYAQITCNKWHQEDLLKTIDLIETLVQDVPVYHFACTISKEAVFCLKQALADVR